MAKSVPAKKADKSEKREKRAPDPNDSGSDDDDDEEEEEEIESEVVRRKRERGRKSFLLLVRRVLALISLAMVLSKQPFMMRPRQPGVNSFKLKPLEVGIAGAVHWAATSPTALKNPKLAEYLNLTSRVLLTPHEYVLAQQSKRAMPNEQTVAGAYKKSDGRFKRLVDKDAQVLELIQQPMPNMALIGSYALIVGTLLCPLIAGIFEYVIVIGCVLLLQVRTEQSVSHCPSRVAEGPSCGTLYASPDR